MHQLLLSYTSLQTWTLNAERTNLVSQNKEGLVSFPGPSPSLLFSLLPPLLTSLPRTAGYLAIHLLGLASGLYILPPDPYFFPIHSRILSPSAPIEVRRKFEEKRSKMWRSKPGKLANLLGSYAVVWWVCYYCTRLGGAEVSRRLVCLSLFTSSLLNQMLMGWNE